MQANAFAVRYSVWRTCTIALALIGVLATQALAVASVTDVNVANKPDCVVISVQGDAALKMTVLQSSAGRYLGFQFPCKLVAKGRVVGIHSGRIFNVRYSRFQENPPLARLVLNTASHLDYSTQWNDDKTRVEITVWKFGASRSTAARTEPMTAPKPIVAKTEPVLPVLPPAEISGPQGSEPGKAADSIAVKVKPEPMRVVRVASAAKPELFAQASAVPASSGAGTKVSLNFLGADIADVLKAMSIQSGENIVVGSDVTGSITVTLEDVTVDEALDYITQLSGYHYIRDQHTYLVGSTGTVGGLVDARVQIVTLAYANADDVLEMLKVQCPQVRTSKISVRGGTARVHKQELRQGTAGGSGSSSGGEAPAAATAGGADGEAAGPPGAGREAATSAAKPSEGILEKKVRDITESVPPQGDKTPTSSMVALVGSAEKVAAAKAFIDQVEEAMRGQADDAKVGVYSVKHVNTWELANTIMSLVMGVNVMIGPSDETGPAAAGSGVSARNVPANMLSGENQQRPYYDYQNTGSQAPNSHTLIIVGKAPDMQKAMDSAAQFDVPGETDLATYKTKYVDIVTLASAIRKLVPGATVTGLEVPDAATATGGGASASAGQGSQSGQSSGQGMEAATMSAAAVNNLSRVVVITGRKSDVAKAKTLIQALDVKSPQIRIEAKITSLTKSGEKKLGLSWDWGKLSVVEDLAAPLIVNDPILKTDVAVSPNVSVNKSLNRYWRQPLNFGATLEALITNGDGKLLAAPSLVCLEGKPGRFFVGDQIRFVTQISVAANGEPTVTTDTADVGVQLSVVGNVSDDGYITLNLHPEVSVVRLDAVQTAGLAMNLPTITRRYTDHVVRVKSGQTITIGGLINDQEVKEMTKVPLLGDLPILGSLFRHTRKTSDHSEVVIFINASVVED